MATVTRPPRKLAARPGHEVARPRRRRSPALLLIAPSIVFMTLMFAWPLVVGVGQAVTGPSGPTTANLASRQASSVPK